MNAAQLVQLGAEHHRAGRFHEAEKLYRQALTADPSHADAWHLLGMIAHEAGQNGAAIDYIRHAITLDGSRPQYYSNLGTIYKSADDLDRAREWFQAALRLQPDYAAAHHNLALTYKDQGLLREALASYRAARRDAPPLHAAHHNYLLMLNYLPDLDADALFEEHRQWGRLVPPPQPWPHANSPDPERRLRLGYVSPDFRSHPVARFFEPLLTHHDRERFEVYLYGEVPHPDDVTRRFQEKATAWRMTAGRGAAAVADQVRADRIDILIDLAGHMGYCRLDVFALKPAPLQATYLGYPNTTGLSAIDFWLTDAVVHPPGEPTRATERLVRLPGGISCFLPPAGALPVAAPPFRNTGRITFGSHHALFKLNDRLLALWRRVLDEVPAARLVIARSTYTAPLAATLRGRLAAQGIDPSRVEVRRLAMEGNKYLDFYGDIDVVLDAWPFTGCTTTCEALWMGVPVVTLRGDRPAGRLSASVLSYAGLADLIAETPDGYVGLACAFARDGDRLAQLRAELRPRIQARLCQGAAFTRQLEAAYRQLWRDWCQGQAVRVPPPVPVPPPSPARNDERGQLFVVESPSPVAPEDPITRLRAALRQRPDSPELHNELGIALARAGRLDEARTAFERAIQVRPDQAGAYNNLGNVLRRLGHVEDAERAVTHAIRLAPTEADYHINLGYLLRQQGRLVEAVASFRNAVRFQPGRADALKALGSVLFDLGCAAEAVEPLRQALAVAPDDAEAHNDLGNVYRQLDREEEAVASYRQALRVNPNLVAPHANLGNLLAEEGKTEEARQQYEQAHRLQPLQRLRLLFELLLPVIYDSMDHLHESRERLSVALQRLHEEGARLDPTQELVPTHFYLAYQGHNDRDLHAAIARLGDGPRRLEVRPAPAARGSKVRIGFLSKYLRAHTIGQLNHGLIARLSRDRFEVTVLSVGPPDEGLGREIQQSADRYVVVPSNLGAALQTVAALGLDVLYLPDIGMDTQTYTMAFSRLAPVQCVTWGHPVTTGLPTVDYFLSSQDLEVEGAEAHYTEKLVRLPRLGVVYDRPVLPVPRKDRAAFGLPEDAHLYVCPQTLFKFHPEFDDLLAGIFRQDPAGLLVLIEGKYPHWNELLRRRFGRSMPDVQGRVRFLPRQGRGVFLNLLAVADVMLDPIHFGGGNTSYEGLALGVPIVTLPSQFLRGRLTYAMYRQMGIPDLVAADAADYVRRAVRLGTEPDYREQIRRRITEASGVLFDDVAVVREVERFLVAAAGR